MNKSHVRGYLILFLVFVVLVLTSLFVGNYKTIVIFDVIKALSNVVFDTDFYVSNIISSIVLNIRIPRTLSAIIIGSALAAAGCCYQEVFKNDLASPDILGVSSGACVGAAIAIVSGASVNMIQMGAFLTGLSTVVVVYLLSYAFKGSGTVSLLISGMLISGLMNSILGLIKYMANQETQLPSIVYWTMGDISSISMKQIGSVIVPMIICFLVLFAFRWKLNYFSVSDNEAISMGVNLILLRVVVIVSATVLVGCAVAIAGTISWIGLVIPHLIKTIFGKNIRYSYPYCCIAGASFLLGIDIIGRLISTSEIPLSILTGIVGLVIFFGCLLCRRKR